MSKDYNVIDGIIKQTRECVTDAYNKGYKDGYMDGQVVTQQAFDAEYERGFNDGHKALVKDMDGKTTYQRGLEDAWNVIHKIVADVPEGGLDACSLRDIFGLITLPQIISEYSPQDVMQKIKEYEEKHDRACPILDDYCPYPWLKCEECEVYCVMKRANKAIEENINKRLNNKED